MAKALLGYSTGLDQRVTHQLSAENRQLRQRVEDLEALVLRLRAENDVLAAAGEAKLLTLDEDLQLA
ncbi:MAG: hypothetical protein HZY75_08050 [Nocardioidaceae bacterium]|nr:MAG: hypothetical protein HZY75_08050 [Nocardioidaceae bacterium]